MTPNETHIAELSRRNLETNFENWKAAWRNRKMNLNLTDPIIHICPVCGYVTDTPPIHEHCDSRKESIPVTTDRRASTSARELKEMLETQKHIVERVAVGCIAWALGITFAYLFVAAWLG